MPVTIEFRIGIDERYRTQLEAGRIGQEESCAAVGLHARTAAQLYDGEAWWDAIAELKHAATRIPVLGNGDVWEAQDALRMMRATGCDGVIVGRGCLGRPWLFRDLADVFDGREPENPPDLGAVPALRQRDPAPAGRARPAEATQGRQPSPCWRASTAPWPCEPS